MAKTTDCTVHMVGHGHIDPTWLWRWTEGYEEVRATFRSALDRMNETPAFKFTASSACFYAWVKASDPEMFEEIRARVREGRWELAGGWWVEPDCNIPCGEAFVRHGLYSQRFFQKEFGARATVGFNPDSFGHAGTLPQIYKKLGIDYYVYMRPCPVYEMDYPNGTTFWWRANDGSVILACNLQESYGAHDEVLGRIKRLPMNPHLNPGQTHILGFYGVGNHGGGPTRKAIAQIIQAKSDRTLPKVLFSTLREFFDAFLKTTKKSDIPTIATDLQHHARGCYSAHSEIKRLNRQCEHALMAAERFATAAWLLDGHPYPEQQFEYAWKDVLYNQFHDVLAGTSLQSAYEDTRDQLGAARHRADVIANEAIQCVARTIDTTAEGNTVVAINPLPWPVTQTIRVAPIVDRLLEEPIHFVDDTEQPVACQAVLTERIGSTGYAFTAELPAMGYRCFHARSGARNIHHARMLAGDRSSLENDWWRIEFDPYDGHICRLYDKNNHCEVLRKGNVLACMVDSSDTWSHGYEEFRVEAGRFGNARLELLEIGDVLATIRVTSTFDKSIAEQFITLYRDVDTIDCEFRINWQQRYTMLKLAYETCVEDGQAAYDTAYGVQFRNTHGFEEPGQQWFDLTGSVAGEPYGFAVLNDSKYGFDVCGNIMRVTMLRSPAYAHHDRARYDSSLPYAIMDQGWQTVKIRLVPHAGPWEDARVPKKAWELNEPAFAHIESAHKGRRRMSASLVGTEADNVLLSVIKKSEDGNDLIVRGYETAGRPVSTTLHFPFKKKTFHVAFGPHEIKTLRINPRKWTLQEVNLLEE
ncbi:MAG TPA: glycoside hydrolase family 38 C-terminal domain-containing protein [Candidatus Hydrogenedentes bacterium]|nr:glycoside hydrolase family 38 C-terminal domain-containing protein [Candidatus Hydrogenedentota bacterium]